MLNPLEIPAVMLALGSAIATPSPVATPRDAVGLFNSVCLADQVSLSKSDFTKVAYSDLPEGARKALGFAMMSTPAPGQKLAPQAAVGVPNEVVAELPKRDVFLLLPVASSTAVTAPMCAVIWRGNHYPEAQKAARAIVQDSLPKSAKPLGTNIPGINFESIHANGAVVGAAEFLGWTVLRAAPDTSPEESANQ